MAAASIGRPAGMPSRIAVSPSPCDSPAVWNRSTRSIVESLLPAANHSAAPRLTAAGRVDILRARSEGPGGSRMSESYTSTHLGSFADAERGAFESTLRQFVEIPTVSVDPARRTDVARGADFAVELIRKMGGEARVIPTPGHPIVHGSFRGDPAWPTVTLYNHLDVQPAERGDGWNTDPFTFTQRDGTYYGRGATDDKGPALSALWGMHYARRNGARVNLQLLWEMEEEIGSPHFESTIRSESARLK